MVGTFLLASPALAAPIYTGPSFSFGPDGTELTAFNHAGSIAIDPSDNAVYVATRTGIEKFNTAGQPTDFSSTPGSNRIKVVASTIAVGPNHDIYANTGSIVAFKSNGEPDDFTAGPGAGTNEIGDGGCTGFAVDSSGDLYCTNPFDPKIPISKSDGELLTEAEASYNYTTITVDSRGDIYNIGYYIPDVEKDTPSEFPVTPNTTYSATGGFGIRVTAISVDPLNNGILMDQGDAVSLGAEDEEVLATFAGPGEGGELSESNGLAVDAANGDLYVSDAGGAKRVEVFPPVFLPTVSTGAASSIERSGATLSGKVNPEGIKLEECAFEYVTEAAFEESGFSNLSTGGTASCEPNAAEIGEGKEAVDVQATLSNLGGNTGYRFRIFTKNEHGSERGATHSFETLPAVENLTTEPASSLEPSEATLHGSFNGDGTDTRYYFEYGISNTYGHFSVLPPGADNGSGSGIQHLTFIATHLQPGHTYHYRLVAENGLGLTYGEDEKFETPSQPTIEGVSSSNLTATTAELHAVINPQHFETTYRFEYGTTTDYGSVAPIPEGSIGSGSSENSVTVDLTNLQPHVVYHYRLLATNQWGTTSSEDLTFNFFPASCPNEELRQETNSGYLPDCRAYELVSPSTEGQAVLFPGGGAPAAPYAESPTRFAFSAALGSLPGSDAPDTRGDTYVSTRTPTGWVTHYVGIRGNEALSSGGGGSLWGDASLDKFIDFAEENEASDLGNSPFAWDSEGNSLGRWPKTVGAVIPNSATNVGAFQPSPEFTHLVISSNNLEWASGGLTSEPGSVYDYDPTSGTTTVISLLPHGGNIPQVPGYNPDPPDGSEPAPSSYIELPNADPSEMQHGSTVQYQQGVSTNGSRILMAAPSQAPCHDYDGCYEPAPVRLYMRVDDATTIEIAPGRTVDYVGMTPDASKVYFTSEEQLTPEDHDTSTDLYMWSQKGEEEGRPLTLISKGDNNGDAGEPGNTDSCKAKLIEKYGPNGFETVPWTPKCGVVPVETGTLLPENRGEANGQELAGPDTSIASENGDIYFYSPEQLDGPKGVFGSMNLYDYSGGEVHFVASFEPSPECNQFPNICRDVPITRMDVSPDDSHVAFVTPDQITANDVSDPTGDCFDGAITGTVNNGAPPDKNCEEMYSYEPASGKTVCVSCNPNGQPPTHNVDASTQGLFMSNDGRIFFSTREGLVETDTNNVTDVYEYAGGRPQLITTGTDSADHPGGHSSAAALEGGLSGVSANGINVYFSTRDTLVPEDENGQYLKFYDARTGGGFAFVKPPAPCESADECHGAGSSAPNPPDPGASAALGGGGNATPVPSVKHEKQKKRRRGARRHHKRAPNTHHRRGGAR